MGLLRMRCSESIHILSTKCVAVVLESAFEAAIMNVMIIRILAACSTFEPSRIAPVIIPGVADAHYADKDECREDDRSESETYGLRTLFGL